MEYISEGVIYMSDFKEILWDNPEAAEHIEFIHGYYKLMSRQEMIPLGRTVEDVKVLLKLLGRNDILENI